MRIACAAVFVSLNNSSVVSFCCFTNILQLEPRLKFRERGRQGKLSNLAVEGSVMIKTN